MPWTFSLRLDEAAFAALARALAEEFEADLFLSGRGLPGKTRCLAGIVPANELIVDAVTTPDEIAAFAFGPGGRALGYLAYPYGQLLRGAAVRKHSDVPLGHLKKYVATAAYDRRTERLEIVARDSGLGKAIRDLCRRLPGNFPYTRPRVAGPCRASLDRTGYEAAVLRAIERIRDGDVYQVNLSIEFAYAMEGWDGPGLFFDLLARYPAPFYVWFVSGRHRLLSTSPERFLSVRDRRVLSTPIKGTALIGGDGARAAAERLRRNPKEDAELSMIVDLIRNDVSLNCASGSVAVEGHKSITKVDGLLQMHSTVTGTLRHGRTCLDLLLDAFPGGSVTGCPKSSALRIIDELEPHSRGVYCGAFLVVDGQGMLDSSIAIRTAVYDVASNELVFHAGSGIVVDSRPALEYEETLSKARKFLDLAATAR